VPARWGQPVATNAFLTDDVITLESLSVLENHLVAAKHTDRKKEALFGTHGGSNRSDTIRVRKPNQYTVRTGRTFSAQNVEDQYTTMVVDTQIGVDTEIYSDEFKQDLSSFSDQVIKPQVSLLANYIDAAVLAAAKQTHNLVGTLGTVPSALSTYLAAGVKLDQNACPRDGQRAMIIGPQMQADIVDALKGLPEKSSKIGSQYESGEIGRGVAGFNWDMDQNVQTHTAGPLGGTPLLNGAPANGATTLVTDGWTAAAASRVKANDVFTIANVYAVNPVSKASTGVLAQFRVTADGSSDAGGALTLSIEPAIYSSGARQNVSAAPADNAALTFYSAANATGANGAAWHKSAIALAFAPLPKPDGVDMASTKTDKQLGVSLRFIRWYDGDSDLWKARFDVKYGIKVLRPEWVCRIASGAA
jgi:hypothetical protein